MFSNKILIIVLTYKLKKIYVKGLYFSSRITNFKCKGSLGTNVLPSFNQKQIYIKTKRKLNFHLF
jgi:hypothetical protein